MDPYTTIYGLLDAMARNDREEVNDHLEALAEWNNKGGFLPEYHRNSAFPIFTVWKTQEQNRAYKTRKGA